MKGSHQEILDKIKVYLEQPGAEHLRFWQALYGAGVIKSDMVTEQRFLWEAPEVTTVIRDDFNISDEALLKRIK